MDQNFIDSIYIIIDDLIDKKLSNEHRFLVIGDFFFSFMSHDFKDPSEFYMKINRNSYITKIKVRADINTLLGVD
jgi:hypothetical protein